jgi:hypothetical protein
MKLPLYLKVAIGIVFSSCLAHAQQAPDVTHMTAPAAGATISDFNGNVNIQLPGQRLLSPARGQVLPPESIVSTDDGRLLLRLTDGSNILMGPHTRLVVKEPETNAWHYLQLLFGRIRTSIQKHLGGTPSFEMGTPTAVISVRGTRFDVEVNLRGFTQVDVQEGVVELESANGRGEPVTLTAGFSSRVGPDSGPEAPRPTRDLRPQLDRPRPTEEFGDDDLIKRLDLANPDGRLGNRGGEDSGPSGGSPRSGSGGSQSGSGGGDRQSGSENEDHSSGGDDHHTGGGKPPDF